MSAENSTDNSETASPLRQLTEGEKWEGRREGGRGEREREREKEKEKEKEREKEKSEALLIMPNRLKDLKFLSFFMVDVNTEVVFHLLAPVRISA